MGEWDVEEVRRLFTSLEFRTLFDRLMEVGASAKPKVEVAELDLREVTAGGARGAPRRRPRRRRGLDGDATRGARHRGLGRRCAGRVRAADALRAGGRRARRRRTREMDPRREGRSSGRSLPAAGVAGRGLRHDARRLPARAGRRGLSAAPPLRALPGHRPLRRGRGRRPRDSCSRRPVAHGRRRGGRRRAARAGPGGADRSSRASAPCSRTSSCRSPPSSRRMEARGVRLDVAYLEEMGGGRARPDGRRCRRRSSGTRGRSST